MPSSIFAKMLQPYSHQTFYIMTRLFHRELIRRESEAALQVDLALKIVADSRFHNVFKNEGQHTQLHDMLFGLMQSLNELVHYTRASNLRSHKTEDFYPYDAAMWDAFFTEIVFGISSRVKDIRAKIKQFQLADLCLSTDARSMHWIQVLTETKSVVEQHLSEVEKFLETDFVEGWIACERMQLQIAEIQRTADELLRLLNEPSAIEFATGLHRSATLFSDRSMPFLKEILSQYGTLFTTTRSIRHEFGGWLNLIIGYAELLLGMENLPPPQRDLVDQIQRLAVQILDWVS